MKSLVSIFLSRFTGVPAGRGAQETRGIWQRPRGVFHSLVECSVRALEGRSPRGRVLWFARNSIITAFPWRPFALRDEGTEASSDCARRPRASGACFAPQLMSDDSPSSPEIPSGVRGEAGPRVRRISNPRPKKKPKTGGEAEVREETVALSAGAPEDPQPSAQPRPLPQFPSSSEPEPAEPEPAGDDESSGDSDWPEPEPASQGASGGQEGSSKRKRRRKKGKGGGGQGQAPSSAAEGEESSSSEAATVQAPRPQAQPQQQQPPRVRVDGELLAKFAWKIYLAEVSEEGVALISDGDARELSRRCFRLAEIFLEEQGRRR